MSRDLFKNRASIRTLILVTFFLALSVSVLATSEGKWQYSGDDSCPLGMVCADWEVDGFVETSCCIQPQYVGTSNTNACATFRPPPDPKKPSLR